MQLNLTSEANKMQTERETNEKSLKTPAERI